MKKTLYSLLALLLVTLTSCFDIYQDIKINEDGSGVMTNKVDMSSIMSMMSQMGGMGEEELKMDTVISFNSYTDTSTKLSAEEKALLKDAKLQMKASSEDGVFIIEMTTPFKKAEDIDKLKTLLEKQDFMGDAIGKMMDKGGEEKGDKAAEEEIMQDMDGGGTGSPKMGISEEYFTYVFKKGQIGRSLNTDKISGLANDEMMQKMKEAMDQGMPPMRMVYTITLPKPVKKAEGKNLVLSDDRKTITVENTMDELFDDPSKFEFMVEY